MLSALARVVDPAFWGLSRHTPYKPGETAPETGQYEIMGVQGIPTGKERTVQAGDPLPPVEKTGQHYRLRGERRSEAAHKPGEIAPTSGQYEIVGADGVATGVERTVNAGDPLPPAEEPGQRYRLADATATSER